MLRVINSLRVSTVNEITKQYPGLAYLILDVESPVINGIMTFPRGKLYAVADREDLLKLYSIAKKFKNRGRKTMVNACTLKSEYQVL